ncbi:glycerol-3-phosphate dehydrogenase (NAD(+)) [Ranunculus cassubicifolius]
MGENTEEKHSNGSSIHNSNGTKEKLDELRRILGKPDGDLLKIVGVGAGAWGCVFAALLQDSYGHYREKVQIRVWRRAGRAVDRATAEHLFDIINSREDVLRRLIRRCAYLKYVEARLGDRTLYADEILKDGFCLNMIDTPLCPLKVVTNLQEAMWDADIVVNGLPSTETHQVFEEISKYWKERITMPIIITLSKGIEAALKPLPHIVTPTRMINQASKHSHLILVFIFRINIIETTSSFVHRNISSKIYTARLPLLGPILIDTLIFMCKFYILYGLHPRLGMPLQKLNLNCPIVFYISNYYRLSIHPGSGLLRSPFATLITKDNIVYPYDVLEIVYEFAHILGVTAH